MARANQVQFEFISCSGDNDDKPSLTQVRKHVMHDYFRRQGRPEKVTVPVRRKSKKKGCRPKLAPEPSKPVEAEIPCTGGSSATLDPRPTEVLSMDPYTGLEDLPTLFPSSKSPTQESLAEHHLTQIARYDTALGILQFDPFDSLPVSGVPSDALYWHFALRGCSKYHSPWIYKTNVAWMQRVWNISTKDKGLFNMLLSRAERNRRTITGSSDKARQLYHQGQAMQILRERFAEDSRSLNESLVLLITSQTSEAMADGDFEIAQLHLRAATSLLTRHKSPLSSASFMHMTQMDVQLAAISMTPPILDPRFGPHDLTTQSHLRRVIQERTIKSRETFPLDFNSSAANEVLFGLHWMALAYDQDYTYEADSSLILVHSYLRTQHQLVRSTADICKSEVCFCPRTALLLCMNYLVWVLFPAKSIPWIFHPAYMKKLATVLLSELVKRLHVGHESPNQGLVEDWEATGASANSLLWVLFIAGAMACTAERASLPFLRATKAVTTHLRIFDLAGFTQALKLMPWTEDFCEAWAKIVGAQLGFGSIAQDVPQWPPHNLDPCYGGACPRHDVQFI